MIADMWYIIAFKKNKPKNEPYIIVAGSFLWILKDNLFQMIIECLIGDKGGSCLIHFLQLRRFLQSLDGSTNTGGSPKCFTRPHALWSCYTTKHQRMVQVGTWVVETTDGAITSTWLVVWVRNRLMHWIRMGYFMVDEDTPITIVLFITILQNKQKHHHALSRQIQEIQDEYIL